MHRSRLAVAVIDLPHSLRREVVTFYEGLTGGVSRIGSDHDEFSVFGPGSGFQLLVQGIEGKSGVHLDVHTDNLEAEVSRLVALGAVERVRHGHWVVLEDPAGMAFCVVPTPIGDPSLEGANLFDDQGRLLDPQPRLTPFLWMNGRIREALEFYSSIFPSAQVVELNGFPEDPQSATIIISGQRLQFFNGGPMFPFTEAISMSLHCAGQEQADQLWEALVEGGGEHGRCGWLKDRFGLSWQVVPEGLSKLLSDPDPGRAARALSAMREMGRLDLAAMERAASAV